VPYIRRAQVKRKDGLKIYRQVSRESVLLSIPFYMSEAPDIVVQTPNSHKGKLLWSFRSLMVSTDEQGHQDLYTKKVMVLKCS